MQLMVTEAGSKPVTESPWTLSKALGTAATERPTAIMECLSMLSVTSFEASWPRKKDMETAASCEICPAAYLVIVNVITYAEQYLTHAAAISPEECPTTRYGKIPTESSRSTRPIWRIVVRVWQNLGSSNEVSLDAEVNMSAPCQHCGRQSAMEYVTFQAPITL